ncbi:MAG TPA: carbohydrate kinase family protein [bacterium]|nr:carbohydrate kinase family protein [bacterium]
MGKKVLCIGIIVGDFLVKPVRKMPEKGKLNLVDRAELHIGGCAANTGIDLKKLGCNVAIIGKVGNDNLGKFLINKLKEEGIDTDGIKITDEINTSGTSVLVYPDGERSFLHSIGANSKLRIEDIDFDNMKNFHILHIAGTFVMPEFDGRPTEETLKKAKEMGLITVLDTVWNAEVEHLSLIEGTLKYIDYFLPSYEEAKVIAGKENVEEIGDFLLSKGVRNVGIKMGEKGSYIVNSKERHYFPALNVDVVDTTGAGDGYVAGFITGIVNNYNFEKCGLLANVVGAKITTSVGATSGIISWDDLKNFWTKYGIKI